MARFGRHTGTIRRRLGFAAGEISQPWILDKWSRLPVATPHALCLMLLPPKVRRERDTSRPVAEFGRQEGTAIRSGPCLYKDLSESSLLDSGAAET